MSGLRNGIRGFHRDAASCTGSNWIPADNFLTTISPDRYRSWLTLLCDGNQNMVRLWGGGVYEPDVFYDICDGNLADMLRYRQRLTLCFS